MASIEDEARFHQRFLCKRRRRWRFFSNRAGQRVWRVQQKKKELIRLRLEKEGVAQAKPLPPFKQQASYLDAAASVFWERPPATSVLPRAAAIAGRSPGMVRSVGGGVHTGGEEQG